MSIFFYNLKFDYINNKQKFKIFFFIKIILILINFRIIVIKSIIINNLSINQNNDNFKIMNNVFEVFKLDRLNIYISQINYIFSFKFNITKLIYNITFYNDKQNIILPSHLSLYYNLHVFCNSNEINNNISIIYIPNIYENKYFSCIEYIEHNTILQFGILLYKSNKFVEFYKLNIFTNKIIDYNNFILKKDEEFEPLIKIKNFYNINKIIKEENTNINYNKNNTFQLKKLYYLIPNFNIKSYLSYIEEKWYFKNIYNNYFCFCKYSVNSKCLYKNINQKYKYYLYLNFIDNNKYIYNKTDYLFADFSSENTSPGEAYLIFKEMFRQKLNVYYLTKREDILKEYMTLNSNNISYKPIIYDSHFIDGNFLEKYFDIFLKLKAVVSGAKIYSFNNLFYNIEYITYICLTHGISYLKDFLYIDYYSKDIYNKIVLPPSNLIISNAKKFRWKDDDIIKIGLPRWDIFYNYEKNLVSSPEIKIYNNQFIFMMFTWRELKNNQYISKYYFKNILNLINNEKLNYILMENNITLYYSLHHMIENFKNIFHNNKYIKYKNQEQIMECLTKSNLIITDFSSIIFDIMIKNKPYIIFIPDSEDSNIDNIYSENYSNIIKKLKNGTIKFYNTFFSVNNTLNKIIYYINNNFTLESSLQIFYKKFNLTGGNNINNFIKYLKQLN